MSLSLRNILRGAGAALGLALAVSLAHAQTTVKVGGVRTTSWLPITHALKQGYFKAEGLDVQLTAINTAPGVVSAVAGGSVDVGYGVSVSAIFARAQNQPIRMFAAYTYETGTDQIQWFLASKRSGIKSLKELQGKTLAVVSMGSVTELMVREQLAKAGVPFDSVKTIVVPFPQMQAALQLGTADAVSTVEPFRTSISVSPDIGAVQIGAGILADTSQRYAIDVLIARDDWGNANKATLRKFNRALTKAIRDFQGDPALFRRAIQEEFKLSPAVISLMKTTLNNRGDLAPNPAEIKPLLDALARHGMIKAPLTPQDVILTLD